MHPEPLAKSETEASKAPEAIHVAMALLLLEANGPMLSQHGEPMHHLQFPKVIADMQ